MLNLILKAILSVNRFSLAWTDAKPHLRTNSFVEYRVQRSEDGGSMLGRQTDSKMTGKYKESI